MVRCDFKIKEKEAGVGGGGTVSNRSMWRQESSEPGLCALRLSSRTVRTVEEGRPKSADRSLYEHSLEFPKASESVCIVWLLERQRSWGRRQVRETCRPKGSKWKVSNSARTKSQKFVAFT